MHVKVWFNSFIPRDVPGVTHGPVTAGPYVGWNYVLGPPGSAHGITTRRGAFLTSDRVTFSDLLSRGPHHFKMHTEVDMTFGAGSPVHTVLHRGGASVEVDPATGAVVRMTSGSTARMWVYGIPSWGPGPATPTGGIKLRVSLSSAIPLIPLSGTIADMDIIGYLLVDPGARTVVFDGKVDEFPAYEAYVSADSGPPLALFRQPILPGKTPSDLIGFPTLPPLPGTVRF
jgi:hypothetical protein